MVLENILYIEIFSVTLSSRGEARSCMREKTAGVLGRGSEYNTKQETQTVL